VGGERSFRGFRTTLDFSGFFFLLGGNFSLMRPGNDDWGSCDFWKPDSSNEKVDYILELAEGKRCVQQGKVLANQIGSWSSRVFGAQKELKESEALIAINLYWPAPVAASVLTERRSMGYEVPCPLS